MSLKTWKEEFYPVDARSPEAQADPVAHSLRKWEGLRPEAMAKHGVRRCLTHSITDDNYFPMPVDAVSCALCQRGNPSRNKKPPCKCDTCPLALSRGGTACDKARDNETLSPWESWELDANPEPMIAALKRCQE